MNMCLCYCLVNQRKKNLFFYLIYSIFIYMFPMQSKKIPLYLKMCMFLFDCSWIKSCLIWYGILMVNVTGNLAMFQTPFRSDREKMSDGNRNKTWGRIWHCFWSKWLVRAVFEPRLWECTSSDIQDNSHRRFKCGKDVFNLPILRGHFPEKPGGNDRGRF